MSEKSVTGLQKALGEWICGGLDRLPRALTPVGAAMVIMTRCPPPKGGIITQAVRDPSISAIDLIEGLRRYADELERAYAHDDAP